MGDVLTCGTNGSVVPYLSDEDVSTWYLWQGSSYLDLDIPNTVCLEAIVMTFNKQSSSINLPTFTTEPSTTFNTTYPSSPDGIDNTTITFSQQYCQPSVRINMTQANPAHFIILLEVFLIQPVDPSSPMTDPPTTVPSTEPASSSTASTTSNPTQPSSALRVRSYRCTPHGRNDPACSRMGDVFTCATNGGVVPYLSDGVVSTRYLWQGSSYLDLDIPNSVCLEAVVMTFALPSSTINLPTFTIAQSTTVNTTYPPGTIAVGNTTITFAQQYCQPTIRINMTQAVSSRFTVLHEVFLIQPVDPSSPLTDPPTTMPPTEPAPSSTASTPSNPTDSQPPPVGKTQPSPTSSSSQAEVVPTASSTPVAPVPQDSGDGGGGSGWVVPVVGAVVGVLLVGVLLVLVVVLVCVCVGRRGRWKPLALKTSSVRFRSSISRKSAFNDPEYVVSKDSPRPEIIVIRNTEDDDDSVKDNYKANYAAVGPSESIHRDVAAVLNDDNPHQHQGQLGRAASQESIHSRDVPVQYNGRVHQGSGDGRTEISSPGTNAGSATVSPPCDDTELLVKHPAGSSSTSGKRRTPPPVPVQLSPQTDGGGVYDLPPDSTRDDTYEVPPDSRPEDSTYDLPPEPRQDDTYDLPSDARQDDTYDLPPDSKPDDTYDMPPDSKPDDTYDMPPDCVQPEDGQSSQPSAIQGGSGLYDLPPDSSQGDTYETPHDALEDNVYEPAPLSLQANTYERPCDSGLPEKEKKKSFWKRSKKEKSNKAAEPEPVSSKGSKKTKGSKKVKRSSSQEKRSPPLPAIPPPRSQYSEVESDLYESPDSILPPGGGGAYAELDDCHANHRPPKPARATKTHTFAAPVESPTYSVVSKPKKPTVAPPPSTEHVVLGPLYSEVDMRAKKAGRGEDVVDTFDQDFWGGGNDPVASKERFDPTSLASQDHLYTSIDFSNKSRPTK